MKLKVLLIVIFSSLLVACGNQYQKEIAEVDGLLTMVNEIEKTVLSVDTSKAFETQRQIIKDLKYIESLNDTLDKETAFLLGDFYSDKKKIDRFYSNYHVIINQIDISKKQLNNLKQDLNNGLVSSEKFKDYYSAEHASIMDIDMKVNKSVRGIDEAIQKLEINRPELDKLLADISSKSGSNEK